MLKFGENIQMFGENMYICHLKLQIRDDSKTTTIQ